MGFTLIFFAIFLFINLLSISFSQAQNPFIPRYDAVKRSERCFTVTWEANNQFGAVWWADKVDFSTDTAFNFVVYMGDRDGNGADGLAFVMHQDPRDTIIDPGKQVIIGGAGTWDLAAATGDDGGGLGYAMHLSRVGPNTIPGPYPGDDPENHKIQKSVAIEIDTWNNTDVPDGKAGADANGVNQVVSPFYGWDHTSVVYNGDIYGQQQVITDANGKKGRILPLKPSYIFGTGNNPDGSVYHNIEDDRCYMFQVKWIVNPDGTQTLQLWADMYNGSTNLTGLQMVMTHTDDMINKVFNGNPVMRFGFTGSTGGSINEQTICLLGENLKPFAQDDYASIPVNTSAIIDVEANDNDPDGDQLHVPIIVDPAKHGSAIIFDSLGTNYMRYTPNTNYVGVDTVGYVTCDVNSTKCYAKCDTANVYITVGCIPFDVNVTALSPNTVCNATSPANGIAEAEVLATFLRGSVWYEGFEDLPAGTINDNGTSAWSSSTSGSCNPGNQIRVESYNKNNKFRVEKAGCSVLFETEVIDINGVSDVNVSIDLISAGGLETTDYLKVYYVLDGGPETPFINGIQSTHFGTVVATANGLNGSTLKIVIKALNTGGDENYWWDNINVTAVGAGVPNVTYNWYDGPTATGPIVNSGAVYNTMHQGTYTVIAIDNNTGCPSNPATVTIDSTGYRVHDGFILPVSPFTNCNLPYDGALRAGVFDGSDSLTVGYEFEWYYQEDPKLPSFIQRTGSLASNLESREYTVVITEIATGCDTTINAEVPNAVNIPTVVATKIQDILSCTDPNSGIGEATVGGLSTGYRFEWYAGPSIGSGPPDFIGSRVTTFPAGTFTVQAIDSVTSCPSDPATITFDDLTILPILQVNLDQQQISCDPLFPTGQVSGSVLVGGVPTTTGYSFNWYKGANDIIPARAGYTGGPVADQLAAGLYRLVVIENGTNCTVFKDTTILEQLINPAPITVTTSDASFCVNPNGSITVNVVGNPADYTYEVYSGSGVIPANLVTTSTNNIIQNLAPGDYTVIAKDLITKCPTNEVFATINDLAALPLITITSLDQVSCDPNNFTGSLTASTAPAPVTDFSFEWFVNDTLGMLLPPTGANGESVTGLDSGTYAVRVTNNVSQCKNVFFPTVNLGIDLPVEAVSSSPSTYCAPSANGQMSASADGGLTAGYSFIWIDVTTSDTLTSQAAIINGIAPGDYTLTVKNNATACLSNPALVNVADNSVTPIPAISLMDNSSCDVTLPNGQLTVTGTNEAPTYSLGDYTYLWIDVSTGIQVPNTSGGFGESANTLDNGTYELRIQNNITTCSNSVLSQIIDINIKPIIDGVIPDHADNCIEPYMSGAIIPSVNGGQPIPAGFTFTWQNNSGGPAISSVASSIFDVNSSDEILPPGNYSVVGLNQFNCPSDTVLFEILDNSIPPVFTLNAQNNISCDPGAILGGLVISRSNSGLGISLYEWFNGSPGSVPPFATSSNPNDSIQINLSAGNYAARITDATTGCVSVEYANIQNAPSSIPSIINSALKDLTRCDIDNGELGYQVIPFENLPPLNLIPRNYTFHLSGSAAYQQTTAGTNNVNFTGLGAGNWSAYVVDEYTKCESAPISNILIQAPEIQITSSLIQKPASCVGNDGILEITAQTTSNNSPSGTGFDFDWFRAFDASGGVIPYNQVTPFRSTADNLTSDFYFIKVTDRESLCEKDTAIFVPSQIVPSIDPFVDLPSTSCLNGNGSATAQLTGPGVVDYTKYNFLLFHGSYFDPTDLAQNLVTSLTPATNPSVFNNLDTGNYTLVAIENFGANCLSSPVSFTIDLDFTLPILIASSTPDNTCNGAAAGTGQLEIIDTSPVMALGDLSFLWSNGENTPQTSANLFAGNYSVEATITGSVPGQGCKIDTILNVPKVSDLISLIANPTPNNNCIPFDGTILVTDIKENGASIGALPGSYANFSIYNASLNPLSPAIGDGISTAWGQLGPGEYYLQAQNGGTKCYSDYLKVNVDDLSQKPVIAITVNNPDYACDPTLADGELEAQASGSQSLADYEFNWYTGAVSAPNFIINNPVASNLTANSFGQLYTIEVVDKSGVYLGCRATKQVTLTHQPTKVYMINSDLLATDQTICAPNGSIELTRIYEDDGTGPISTTPDFTSRYDAQLLDANLNVIDPIGNPYALFDPITGLFGNIDVPANTYYVRASSVATGCTYGPVSQVIVKDVSKKPVISAALLSPDYACLGGFHTGSLAPTVVGGSDGDVVQTNFSITWTVKATGVAAPGGIIATDLWPGSYRLQVVDADGLDQGCVSTRDYIVTSARHNIGLTASGTDQTICLPDGTIQVDNITVDMANVPNPQLTWKATLYDGGNMPIAPTPTESGFASINDPFSNLAAGTYFVKVQDDSTKCYSNPYQVRLLDKSTDPVISVNLISPQYSLNPNPASWTGAMQASVTEVNGIPGVYTVAWHQGIGTANPAFSAIDNFAMADKGNYTYVATNNTTGCLTQYNAYLPYVYLEPKFNTLSFAKTICAPNNGSIEVTDIILDGNPDLLSDYTFSVYHDTYNPGDPVDQTIPGSDAGTIYPNINEGDYYFIAKENWWWVESYPVKVTVIDSTTNPIIVFDATGYSSVTSCDQTVYADGSLAVDVFENPSNPNLTPPYNYTYAWFTGSTTDPANQIPGADMNTITGVQSGTYTVLVMNVANNCQGEKTLSIEDESVIPIVIATQSPNTNCPPQIGNGIVNANVINSTITYDFNWFTGRTASGPSEYTGEVWRNRDPVDYTVVAVDPNLPTCISAPVTVRVENASRNPIVVINELAPVTNCDSLRPNGVLSAVTEKGINGHTFEWYFEGNLYSTGPIASDLGLFTYDLIVTNDVTKCQTTLSSGPSNLQSVIPPPMVDILNDRTSCLNPDGIATATVDGSVVDYIFRYYNKFSGDELTNLYEDYTIYDLDTSTYLVTAESRQTGCVSDPTEFSIDNASYFPDISVIADPSACNEPDGSVNVIIGDLTQDFKVTWYGDNGFVAQEKELVYLPVGKYIVEVEGTDGCISTAEAEVKADIVIYNGVSANSDNYNDYFIVLCLELFLNNNVKIYNRAGMLVYEQDGYDMYNPEKRFNGVSNRGTSILGTDLPIGTYFYVVDKNDGSNAKVGYLELVR